MCIILGPYTFCNTKWYVLLYRNCISRLKWNKCYCLNDFFTRNWYIVICLSYNSIYSFVWKTLLRIGFYNHRKFSIYLAFKIKDFFLWIKVVEAPREQYFKYFFIQFSFSHSLYFTVHYNKEAFDNILREANIFF